MRIIAGTAKGHQLKVPQTGRTRPATDLVRGAVFSMLESVARGWSRVLDLYAGTGALGIESLSRGAQWADFVEQNPRSCAIIAQNLERTGFKGQAHVYCLPVKKALTFLPSNYDIVFIDPPYATPAYEGVIEQVASSPVVGPAITLVVLHPARLSLSSTYGQLRAIKERRHGDTSISIYQGVKGID